MSCSLPNRSSPCLEGLSCIALLTLNRDLNTQLFSLYLTYFLAVLAVLLWEIARYAVTQYMNFLLHSANTTCILHHFLFHLLASVLLLGILLQNLNVYFKV